MLADRTQKLRIAFCFGFLCLVWGSTFLAVKQAIVGMPPFVVTTVRYLLAGMILFAISRVRKESWLTVGNLRLAAVSGFLLAFANALVGYSVTALPTGLVAIVIGSLPAWIIVLDWQFFKGRPPAWGQVIGIALALVGVGALTSGHSQHLELKNLTVWIALFSSIGIWALGTLLQRQATTKSSIFLFSGVQCMTGGLLIGATTINDGSLFLRWELVPMSAIVAVGYLLLVGTVAASTSYVWLNQNADPRFISTYALVTPVVAVWLGWLFAGEPVTSATLVNSLIVIAGVGMILIASRRRSTAPVAPSQSDSGISNRTRPMPATLQTRPQAVPVVASRQN